MSGSGVRLIFRTMFGSVQLINLGLKSLTNICEHPLNDNKVVCMGGPTIRTAIVVLLLTIELCRLVDALIHVQIFRHIGVGVLKDVRL